MQAQQIDNKQNGLSSAPPTHHILLLLDEMQGQPQLVKVLTERLSARLAAAGDGVLAKYVDIGELVEEDLVYLEHLQLAARAPAESGDSVRITALGRVMALGLRPQAGAEA